MKTLKININIPTNKEELKSCLMNTFGWMTHKGRMKNNYELLNELCRDICYELNSGYWNKDISDYMRKNLTDTYNGKIREMIIKTKRRLI